MTGPFIRLELTRRPGRSLLVVLAVTVVVAVVTGAGGLMWGVYTQAVRPLLPQLPLDMFAIEGRRVDVGILSFGSIGGGLDEAAVGRVEGLQGVRAVHPVRSANVPMRAAGGQEVLGRSISTDVFALGVPPALVEEDLPDGLRFEDGSPVPVVLSRRLLDIYNGTVAPVLDKPRLSAEAVRGLRFEILLGTSATRGRADGPVRREVAEVVALSDQAGLGGLTVPAATVARWDGLYGTASPITSAWVEVEDPDRAGRVASAVEQAGFRVDETPKLIGWALALAAGLGVGLAGLLGLLGGASSFLAFTLMVSERRSEIAILRALGAERGRVQRWFLGQALLLGLAGGLLGSLAGWSVAFAGGKLLTQGLEGLSAEMAPILSFPPWMWLLGLLLGTGSALLGSIGPARRAARADPALSLRS
ncbi:MAG: FtsX-like permease family protein [Myxococcota bacterium]